MADANSIILHQYGPSPFAEKIRLALRLKNLGWSAVDIPRIMPKPDLMPLTGGYRRTPVMQIGADIYCDTALILIELERRFQMPSLNLPGHEGLSRMVAGWCDLKWFQTSVGVIFGAMADKVPAEFIEDRARMFGPGFDIKTLKAEAPMLRDQWRSQLIWLEERLTGGQGTGAGNFLVGAKPGLVDVHAFMNPWFMERNIPDFLATCFQSTPLTRRWYERMQDFKGQTPEEITGEDALGIAYNGAPRLKPASTAGELRDFSPGAPVQIAPDNYGKDWVSGDLVIANAERVIIARQDERAGNLHLHFPRVGYTLKRA